MFSELVAIGADEFADARCDHFAPAAPGKNTVVTAFRRSEVLLFLLGYTGAQFVRGSGLTLTGNIIQLTFDGE